MGWKSYKIPKHITEVHTLDNLGEGVSLLCHASSIFYMVLSNVSDFIDNGLQRGLGLSTLYRKMLQIYACLFYIRIPNMVSHIFVNRCVSYLERPYYPQVSWIMRQYTDMCKIYFSSIGYRLCSLSGFWRDYSWFKN